MKTIYHGAALLGGACIFIAVLLGIFYIAGIIEGAGFSERATMWLTSVTWLLPVLILAPFANREYQRRKNSYENFLSTNDYSQIFDTRLVADSLYAKGWTGNHFFVKQIGQTFVEIGELAGKNGAVTTMIIKPERTQPRCFIESQHRGHLELTTMMHVLQNYRRIDLEGDFNEHYQVYIQESGLSDSLVLLSPDFMERLMESKGKYHVESTEESIYVFSDQVERSYESLITMQDLGEEIINKIKG